MAVYWRAGVRSGWCYAGLILSRRIHSIYVLRMFNDCVTMLILYGAIHQLQKGRPKTASLLYSTSISTKMNTLLFLPGFLLILHQSGAATAIQSLALMLVLQVALAAPFLYHDPWAYLSRAFDFSRKFLYKWTVNWKFFPESTFSDDRFGKFLLAMHLILLLVWFFTRKMHQRFHFSKWRLPVQQTRFNQQGIPNSSKNRLHK